MHADAPPSAAPALSHRQILVVFSGIMLGMLLAAIDQTIVATALPTIVGDLGGLTHISWVVTAYLLAETVSTPLFGKLGDLFGRKRLFLAGVAVFVGGAVVAGFAQSIEMLNLARVIQGIGSGMLNPQTFGLIQKYFRKEARARAFASSSRNRPIRRLEACLPSSIASGLAPGSAG